MKSRQFKKNISSVFSLFLVLIMIFSVSVPYVFAQSNTFTGTEDLEVRENERVDLLAGVTATSSEGEALQVIVKDVICETDENYKYDDSEILDVGEVGSVYQIEYEASASSDVEETYSVTRKVTVVSKENPPAEEIPNENQEETPEITPEENQDAFSETVPEEESTVTGGGTPIIYEGGIHYIEDPQYPGKKITLFCMNNKLHWPHHTDDMGNIQVPNYTEGYLTPEHFASKQEYDECMRRLSKLLYGGYPYNGERLYQIVADSSQYVPTEAEFNKMLIVPPVLQTAFPYLGHHDFTYADWVNDNKEHMDYLRKFVGDAIKLGNSQGTTTNGLTATDIYAMPFYKAAFSIINCNNDTPLEAFQFYYGASYFVTEEEAYNATQNAVWHLLYEYNISDNSINALNSRLAEVLYTYSERGGLLDYRPDSAEIEVVGDLHFEYNPKDGFWHSGPLTIREPEVYRGLYRLQLPKGVTVLCDNLNYVYGNETYELVSDHMPEEGEMFGIEGEFVWLDQFKQYTPSPDIEVNGKKFQHMIGAIIHKETVSVVKEMEATNEGAVAITKKVVGEKNNQNDFHFTLTLPYHDEISGLYGDLEFNKGVAEFTLKDGETKRAKNLPSGAYYVVEEASTPGYQIGMTNNRKEVPIADEILVTVTNTKLPDLSLSKTVTGEMGDKTKQFEFVINLKNKNGTPVGKPFKKSFQYVGGVVDGTEATAPQNGTITFTKGEARISLSHGQKITIKDLPYGSTYTVTETTDTKDPYKVIYDGKAQPATGQLKTDGSIDVVNNKEYVPPTGITSHTDHSAGFGVAIAIGGLCALFGFGLFRRRRGWKK